LPNCSHPFKVVRGLRTKYNDWVSMSSSMLLGV
jgi:hypothetical protein